MEIFFRQRLALPSPPTPPRDWGAISAPLVHFLTS
jgi:hypothetical protein